ncbi:MAG TPA: hypothetical protein VF079_00420 [Sphingomicrobium sp.]
MMNELQIHLEELDDGSLDKARTDLQSELSSGRSELAALHWDAVRDRAAGAINAEMAKVDWIGCIAGAWCSASKLRDLAAKTRAAPGTRESLALAQHSVSVDVHPVVTIRCGPVSLPPVRFTVRLDAAVKCAILIVAEGKLAAIEGATLTPSANLYYGAQLLKKLISQEVPITGRHSFANGGIEIRSD